MELINLLLKRHHQTANENF